MIDPGVAIGFAILVLGGVALAGLVLRAALREVGPDERLVIFRLGRPNPGDVRGPGRTLVLPFVDRGVAVSLTRQQVELAAVPFLGPDGGNFAADVEVVLHVIDPVQFALQVISPPSLGIRIIVKALLGPAVADLGPNDPVDRVALEQRLQPALSALLARSGATCESLRVRHVRPTIAPDAREAEIERGLGLRVFDEDPDLAGSRTLSGDLRWGIGRLRRMARSALVSVPLTVAVILAFAPFGKPSLTALHVTLGVGLGLVFACIWDIPDDIRNPLLNHGLGWRRGLIWALAALGWGLASFLLVAAIAAATGVK